MSELPSPEQIELRLDDGVLHLTLNRPRVRNAMSSQMVAEIGATLDAVADRRDVRAIVIRGAGGHFCAGGDVGDMAKARGAKAEPDGTDPVVTVSRGFGTAIGKFDRAPQATIAILEGAVLGGGFGLACVADIAIAHADAKFGLPETGLGLPPAQIAPFIVQRLGVSQARRLAVTGGRLDGRAAAAIGLVHHVAADADELQARLDDALAKIRRCAPGAVAMTKRLIARAPHVDRDTLLDEAAAAFATAVKGPEGVEGTMAFLQKRKPSWAAPAEE